MGCGGSQPEKGTEPGEPAAVGGGGGSLKCEFMDEKQLEVFPIEFTKKPLGITFSDFDAGKSQGVGAHWGDLAKGTSIIICGKVPPGGHAFDLEVKPNWRITKVADAEIPENTSFEDFMKTLKEKMAAGNLVGARRNSLQDGNYF
jgi:hypothetical protein